MRSSLFVTIEYGGVVPRNIGNINPYLYHPLTNQQCLSEGDTRVDVNIFSLKYFPLILSGTCGNIKGIWKS
ncbi:hypothetical protein [Richelia intracellularis]|uniref:hypothetical protein n=1 Tax=Richelia intracellularis TaxID=1164990 RepID=UPI0012DDE0D5|nr:hypothetical protein [Richelia intracellularis]